MTWLWRLSLTSSICNWLVRSAYFMSPDWQCDYQLIPICGRSIGASLVFTINAKSVLKSLCYAWCYFLYCMSQNIFSLFCRTQMQKVVKRRKRRKRRNTRKRKNTRSIRNRRRRRVEKKRVEGWQEDTDRKQSQTLTRKRWSYTFKAVCTVRI